jgi:hypothetical protein
MPSYFFSAIQRKMIINNFIVSIIIEILTKIFLIYFKFRRIKVARFDAAKRLSIDIFVLLHSRN